MTVDPARVYLWSGLLWYGAMRAYWVALVVRITIALELPSLQLVLLGTAMELSLLLAEVPTGVVADRFSRKWSIIIGFLGVGTAQVLAGIVEGFGLLVATQILWGVSYTFRSGADAAWVTDELGGPDAVEHLILRRGRLQQVVAVVSIATGAGLARFTSLTTAVVTSGVVLGVCGLLLMVVMSERGFTRPTQLRPDEPKAPGLIATFRAGAVVTARVPALRILAAVMIVTGLGSEAVDRLDIRRLDDIGLSADLDEVVVVGLIAVSEALVGAAVLWWTRHRIAGPAVPTVLAAFLATSAIGIALLGLVAVLPVAAAGLVFQGGLRQAALPLPEAWANAHAPSSVRATVHSFIGQATSMGEVAGGVLLGAVAAATTVPTAMTGSVLALLVAAALAARGRSRWGPVREDQPVPSV